MKTIILPGYSPKNKQWADKITDDLKLDHGVIPHYWKHWQAGSMNLKYEVEKVLDYQVGSKGEQTRMKTEE